ncbi:hypothetical protein COCMIDRAFT_94259 [Bipolaris oryzae ATCC 44560]|uniref:Uncharacterized protein n=1 Tax=Bipolaris oryzae ATCC 44560 TaxID=930090 RepID=W6ZEG2_COCMI|nr:uncharacterized protein COCMIDRAFT_94259 [Bipolaris oryzae ATCC 44560]EUC45899.1 hypothetical protein COCMIDRAFT_94259 [Bipolaris oryzae ATCC 44560]
MKFNSLAAIFILAGIASANTACQCNIIDPSKYSIEGGTRVTCHGTITVNHQKLAGRMIPGDRCLLNTDGLNLPLDKIQKQYSQDCARINIADVTPWPNATCQVSQD